MVACSHIIRKKDIYFIYADIHKLEFLDKIYMCVYLYLYLYKRTKWQTTPVFLPGKSCGRSLEDCSPWGSIRVRHDLATKQQYVYGICIHTQYMDFFSL